MPQDGTPKSQNVHVERDETLIAHAVVLKRNMIPCKFGCTQKFPTPDLVRKHTKDNHLSKGLYTCSICDKKFMYENHAKTHLQNQEEIYKVCGSSVLHVSRHMKIHEKNHWKTCEICEKRVSAPKWAKNAN